MTSSSLSLADYATRVGQEVGLSDWIAVDQRMIDAFAATTLDDQYIHVDPERAAASMFGGTIAHGFLTLSLMSRMAFDALPQIESSTAGLNYGFNSVRFLAPVKSGERVRGRFVLRGITNKDPGRLLVNYDVSVDIENGPKPALVAQWLTMMLF